MPYLTNLQAASCRFPMVSVTSPIVLIAFLLNPDTHGQEFQLCTAYNEITPFHLGRCFSIALLPRCWGCLLPASLPSFTPHVSLKSHSSPYSLLMGHSWNKPSPSLTNPVSFFWVVLLELTCIVCTFWIGLWPWPVHSTPCPGSFFYLHLSLNHPHCIVLLPGSGLSLLLLSVPLFGSLPELAQGLHHSHSTIETIRRPSVLTGEAWASSWSGLQAGGIPDEPRHIFLVSLFLPVLCDPTVPVAAVMKTGRVCVPRDSMSQWHFLSLNLLSSPSGSSLSLATETCSSWSPPTTLLFT